MAGSATGSDVRIAHMPPVVHKRTFRVRHYECDAYGHVNNANYIRYMQETAFDASAAVGYDQARYDELGTLWLVRETRIEYLQPLVYGDSVTVTTWVGDFRRVRSRRFYDFHHSETGERVAHASTDWVYLDAERGRPRSVPPAMVEAFWPGGPPDESTRREKFPEPPDPPPGVYTLRKRVEWRDIDPAGHMNNAVYFNYIEDCGTQVAAAYGWPMSRIQDEGFALIARRHRMAYHRPAYFGDEVAVSTWVSDVKRSTATRHYTLTRDGELLARCRTLWVWMDLERGRPMRVPEHFLADFAANIVTTESR